MATFPGSIQYQDVSPSGRTPAVGVGMPATGGMEAIGGALQRLGEKIDVQESAVELSQGQRQIEEKGYALTNAVTADPDANQKAWDAYQKDVEGVIGGMKHDNARRALQIHANNQLPQWQETFKKNELAVRHKNAADQLKFEATALAGRGDVGGVAKIYENAHSVKLMSDEEYKYKMDNLFTDVAFEQAGVDIREGRVEQAQKSLSELKDLNSEQLKQKNEMQSLAVEQLNYLGVQFDNNINEQMNTIDQKKDLSDIDLQKSAADLDAKIDASNIGGKRKMQIHKEVRSWVKDEGNMDFERIRSLEDRIERVKAYGVTDPELVPDINRARLEGALGSRKEGSGKEANRLIKSATSAKTNTNITATRKVQEDFARTVKNWPNGLELEHLLHKDILDALDEHSEWNDTQAEDYAARHAKSLENLSEQQSGTLIEMRKQGQKYLGWQDLPQEVQKKDLESIRNLKVPTFMRGKTSLSGDWSKSDVKKAQEIIGGSKEITPDMTKKFSDYLAEQGKAHFEPLNTPRVTTVEAAQKLPSGTQYVWTDGVIYTRK
jgi:hypothetical protein